MRFYLRNLDNFPEGIKKNEDQLKSLVKKILKSLRIFKNLVKKFMMLLRKILEKILKSRFLEDLMGSGKIRRNSQKKTGNC